MKTNHHTFKRNILLLDSIIIFAFGSCNQSKNKNLGQVFIKDLNSITHVINYEKGDLDSIKNKIRDLTGIGNEDQMLMLGGKKISNIEQIKSYASLELSCKLKGAGTEGGDSNSSFTFVDFSKKNLPIKKFIKDAPAWRIIYPGLNLEGVCNNKDCEANGKRVWCLIEIDKNLKKGLMMGNGVDKDNDIIGGANFYHLRSQCCCPICKTYVDIATVKWMGFHKCYYDVVGYECETKTGKRGKRIENINNRQDSEEGFMYFSDACGMIDLATLSISTRPLDYKERALAEANRIREEENRRKWEIEARIEAEKKAEREHEEKIEAERKAKDRIEEEIKARIEAEKKAEREHEEKIEAEKKAKQEREEKIEVEKKAKDRIEEETKARIEAEKKAKQEHEARIVAEKEIKRLLLELAKRECDDDDDNYVRIKRKASSDEDNDTADDISDNYEELE